MKQVTFSKIATFTLAVLMTTSLFLSCSKDDIDSTPSSSGSGTGTGSGTGSGSTLKGTWVREVGASGDETDIAIGNISGEPSDRVYMCEWKGNVGLYKGTISGNTVTWDATYGLPDFELGLENGKMTLIVPAAPQTIKTYYSSGSWSSKCGPLSSSNTGGGSGGTSNETGQVMFWTASDHGCGSISVSIDGLSGSISSYYASSPSCGASGCATFSLEPGTYTYSASCGSYTWGSGTTIKVTANSCFKMKLN